MLATGESHFTKREPRKAARHSLQLRKQEMKIEVPEEVSR